MSISCDCSVVDGDRPAVATTKVRKARKKHKCCECSSEIQAGSRYEYTSGCWDGSWDEFHTCLTCVAIRGRYCPNGWIYGGLVDAISDCLGFDYREVPKTCEDDE